MNAALDCPGRVRPAEYLKLPKESGRRLNAEPGFLESLETKTEDGKSFALW